MDRKWSMVIQFLFEDSILSNLSLMQIKIFSLHTDKLYENQWALFAFLNNNFYLFIYYYYF